MMDTKSIEAVLKEKGCKLTEQRRIIISILQENPIPLTAQEVFDFVRKEYENINFSTIYRNLELLSELGIVSKMNIKSGVSHFELKHMEHHHHLICKSCGEMKDIDVCPFESIKIDEFIKLNFKPIDHKFEIYGYCDKCCKENIK